LETDADSEKSPQRLGNQCLRALFFVSAGFSTRESRNVNRT
jgi:hypothetical protein